MKEKDEPSYKKNEVLVRIKNIGICGTDLHAFAGNQAFFTYPRILGHELSAEVLEIGDQVSHVAQGDRVVVSPYMSCGKCIACRNSKTNCCTTLELLGVHTDGGMQERISVPANLLTELNDLSHEEIAIIEPLSIGAHANRRANVQAGEHVVVLGCGPIGLGIMKFAKVRGAKVIGIDVVDKRLTFAKQSIGVDYTVNATENPQKIVSEITNGEMALVVFDATGNKKALESGPDYMAHGGRYILVGLYNGDLSFHQPSIQKKEATIMVSRNATSEDFENVITLLLSGQFPTDDYVTHKVNFDDMIGEFENWLDPKAGVIKAMVGLTG